MSNKPVFSACCFNRGLQYIASQLKPSLVKLEISICYASVRSGTSNGVIKKFHQIVDSFLREVKVHKICTLDEPNSYWDIDLEAYYH